MVLRVFLRLEKIETGIYDTWEKDRIESLNNAA